MSLFPAYKNATANKKLAHNTEAQNHEIKKATTSAWLQNLSFNDEHIRLASKRNDTDSVQPPSDDANSKHDKLAETSDNSNSSSDAKMEIDGKVNVEVAECKEGNKASGSSKKKNKKNAKKYRESTTDPPNETDNLACPKYNRSNSEGLQANTSAGHSQMNTDKGWKRYYLNKRLIKEKHSFSNKKSMKERKFLKKLAKLNMQTMTYPKEVRYWIKLVELQDHNPYKWDSKHLAAVKVDNIKKALFQLPSNLCLYKLYIEVMADNYPMCDVYTMLKSLVEKDISCFPLWGSFIMITQGAMAKFKVPSVMSLYKRCMETLINAWSGKNRNINFNEMDDNAIVMFHNCALFLRQSGLFEQFITIIKLMIEYNVTNSSAICNGLASRSNDDAVYTEYEDLVINSGLPLAEMWAGLELLRQGFYFMPYTNVKERCTDQQRVVLRNDMLPYICSLRTAEKTFRLLLVVLKLLKFPFIRTDTLAKCIEIDKNSDVAEDLLNVFLPSIHILSALQRKTFYQFEKSVFELTKELVITPTYFNTTISNSIYERCIRDYLINCSAVYKANDNKRLCFLLLWCRFERLLLSLNHYASKLTNESIKKTRSRFRSLLKLPNNRNIALLYVQFALFEYECGSSNVVVENILKNVIINSDERDYETDLSYVYLTYAEILFGWDQTEQACQVICYYALNETSPFQQELSRYRQSTALKMLHDKLEQLISVEKTINVMTLEQHILPDSFISTLKLYTMLLCIIQEKKDALNYLDKLLSIFEKTNDNERHTYLREMIHEQYLLIMHVHCDITFFTKSYIADRTYSALLEYPQNVFMLELWGSMSWMLWYKQRSGFMKLPRSLMSVMMLIVAARFRFLNVLANGEEVAIRNKTLMPCDNEFHEKVVHQRVMNMLKGILCRDGNEDRANEDRDYGSEIYRNALLWRCFFRCLCKQRVPNELKKKWLYAALDVCPWNKSLYLEGAILVPEMSKQLQDILIEKQMRLRTVEEEILVLKGADNPT